MLKLFIAGILLSTQISAADDWTKDPRFTPEHVCYEDMQAGCWNRPIPDVSNEYDCLQARFNALAPACQLYVADKLSGHPCFGEIMRLCTGEYRNKERSWGCLNSQKRSLRKVCRDHLERGQNYVKTRNEVLRKLCTPEDRKLCDKMKGLDMIKCFESAMADKKYSSTCRAELESALQPFNP